MKSIALATPEPEPHRDLPQPPDWWLGEPRTRELRKSLHKLPVEMWRQARARSFELHQAAKGRATHEDVWTQAITEARKCSLTNS